MCRVGKNRPLADILVPGKSLSCWYATLSCPFLSGSSTMKVWIKEGMTTGCQEAQA